LIVNGYKNPCNVSPFVLASPIPKPIIQCLVSTGERLSVMTLSERLNADRQNASPKQAAMSPEGCYQLLVWGRRRCHGFEKSVSIAAGEHHTLMFVEHLASAFVGEVARRQPRNGHRSSNDLLGRCRDAKLNAFPFWLAGTVSLMAYRWH